jgi:hypothetical protein
MTPIRPQDYRFPRRESEESRRIPWASRPPRLPFGIDWAAVGDGAILLLSIIGLLAVAVGWIA